MVKRKIKNNQAARNKRYRNKNKVNKKQIVTLTEPNGM